MNDAMDQKIQLKHPRGKKPVRISKEKYDRLKPLLLKCLQANGESTFKQMSNTIAKHFRINKTKFQGSLPWHLEWVKLDLEARKIIKRVAGTSPQQYMFSK